MRMIEDIWLSAPGRVQAALSHALLTRPSFLRSKISAAAEVADFFDWQRGTFKHLHPYRTREALWKALGHEMSASGRGWHVIELGVASGYATRWWLRRFTDPPIESWHGFDRFTGLPRAWRDRPAGTFSEGGQPPAISDSRLRWHVGDVEQTLPQFDRSEIATGSRLVLFDLDIYEPTITAWTWLRPSLCSGDYLYFDEAFDQDERRVIEEAVLPSGQFRYVGGTGHQLLLQVDQFADSLKA
jgi:hypothetical protein